MEIKLFGKNIFEFKRENFLIGNARNQLKESPYLPDFNNIGESFNTIDYISMSPIGEIKKQPLKKKKETKIILSPKGIFELKMLNDESFKIKADEKYIEEQISLFTDKLTLVKTSEYDMERGVREISSILIRLENRKKYKEFQDFFDQYAYTTIEKVNDLITTHDYLKLGKSDQFVADLPKEAIDEMKKYEDNTKKLCDKKPIFYIIADKKDFQKTDQRRDPILLAQSPFGHVWQILGAWDKEMVLLNEL